MGRVDYRAWDYEDKKMWKVVAISVAHKLMQCVDLKDVKGRKIYEGDIVKDLKGQLFTVEYNLFCAYMLYPVDDPAKFMAMYPSIKLEVIGNIYTDPHLLTQ